MIWHFYDNNSHNGDKTVIIREEHPHLNYTAATATTMSTKQQKYTSSLSSVEDITMQTSDDEDVDDDESIRDDISRIKQANKQSLFLNFTSDLCLHQPNRKKNSSKKSLKTVNKNQQTSYKVNGVNILNRKNIDSKTVIERIEKRRENHNHVERKRRYCINNTILKLSQIIPNACLPGQKLNKGDVLKLALDHILYLQAENQELSNKLLSSRSVPSSPLQYNMTSSNIPTLRTVVDKPPVVLPSIVPTNEYQPPHMYQHHTHYFLSHASPSTSSSFMYNTSFI